MVVRVVSKRDQKEQGILGLLNLDGDKDKSIEYGTRKPSSFGDFESLAEPEIVLMVGTIHTERIGGSKPPFQFFGRRSF